MECTYSTPVNFEGDPPSNSLEQFQFSESSCVIDWPDWNTQTATPSAYIDIASSSAIARGVYDIFGFVFVFALCIIIYIGFRLGYNFLYQR